MRTSGQELIYAEAILLEIMTRRLAAIMFTDVVGFTASAQADEATALARLREHRAIVEPLFARYAGKEIKSTGDGFLVEFQSALHATECALEIQRRINERNAKSPSLPIRLRIGIHVGDVEEVGGDILGDAVNVASRLVPLAEPGGVCLSEQIVDHVRNKVPYALERLPPQLLKGVMQPVQAFRVVLPGIEHEVPAKATPLPRLAVLPFANISPNPKDEYFADGLTEELITVLSQIRGLRVIARTSVAQYKGTTKPIGQIGSELGVDSVLEGSVRKSRDQLRIAVQLIDVKTEEHRWAQNYDRKLENIFAIQSDVAAQTAVALKLELLSSERDPALEKPTSSLAAYDLFLRGIQASRQFSRGVDQHERIGGDPVSYFEQAIREDPRFSAAHSSLANYLVAAAGVTEEEPEAFSLAREHVTRALQLNPRSSDAHTAQGNLAMQADFDWPRAETEFRQALEMNPSNSTAHFWYASLLSVLQRYPEAKHHLEAVFELDPLWFLARERGVSVLALSGDWDAAVRQAEALVENSRADPQREMESRNILAWIYAYVGRPLDAERVDKQVKHPSDPGPRLAHAVFLAWLGKPRGIEARLKEWERSAKSQYMSPVHVVQAYAQLGRKDEALSHLEQDLRNGESYLWAYYQVPYFDPIRDDRRFVAALERLHLPTTQGWRKPALNPKRMV
jgi:adenylate cyclase